VVTDYRRLLADHRPDLVAVANENDLKAEVVLAALRAGCRVVVDKPLAITMREQARVEGALASAGPERLLMLLTLRGQPVWAGLRQVILSGRIGAPAFTHVRMAVRLKRSERPPWFLDVRRSGGLFLDLLIHGLDQVEWLTGRWIVALAANTGNLGYPEDHQLQDHAAVYCELDDGSAALVEGQRMLPDTKGSDYRVTVAGTRGVADLWLSPPRLTVSDPGGADQEVTDLPAPVSVVADWLANGGLVPQTDSLRANRLALLATQAASRGRRLAVAESSPCADKEGA
jgi:predicted dehydrogenase